MRTKMMLAGLVLAVLSGCVLGKSVPPSAGAQQQCTDAFGAPTPCATIPPLPEGGQGGVGASVPATTDGTCATDCASDPSSRACTLCHRLEATEGQNNILRQPQQQSGAISRPPSQGVNNETSRNDATAAPVIASEAPAERSNLQGSSGEQSDPPPARGGARGGGSIGSPTILPTIIGGIQETPDRFEAYTYLPSGYERSHRFSVQQVAGADAIVCMWRDGTQLNVRGPEVVVPTNYMIVGEYSYLSGKSIGCTRASSMLFDPTGRDGEIATFVLFKPVVGQCIASGAQCAAPVWQAVGRVSYRYSTSIAFRTFSSGETEALRRSL